MNKRLTKLLLLALFSPALVTLAAPFRMTAYHDEAGRLTQVGYQSVSNTTATVLARETSGLLTNRVVLGVGDASDHDADTLADAQEYFYFGSLNESASSDPDNDGLTTGVEFAYGGDPTRGDTDADSQSDGEEYIAGTALNDNTDYFCIQALAMQSGTEPLFTWIAHSNRVYQTQYTTNLSWGAWTNYGAPQVASTNGILQSSPCPVPDSPCRIQVRLQD